MCTKSKRLSFGKPTYTSQTPGVNKIPEKAAILRIKILYGGNLKRFRASSKANCYASLCQFIRKSWPKLKKFSLYYGVKEGKTVVIKGEDEMASCLDICESRGLRSLRIILSLPISENLEPMEMERARLFSEGPAPLNMYSVVVTTRGYSRVTKE